jgi:Flp pilus assembly protein TadD
VGPDRRAAAVPFVTLDAIPDNLWPAPVIADGTTAEGFALLRAHRYGEAATALRRIGTSKPEPPSDSPAAHFARAQHAELENRVGDARREYQAAVEGALAGRSVVLVAIGRLAQVEGDLPAGIDALTRASRLNPNDPTIRRELAAAYEADGRHDEALAELVAAWLIDPRDAQIHAAIGQLYVNTGRESAAVPAFERALQLRPEGYETRYALAMAHARIGHAEDAARQLDRFDRARRDALAARRRVIASDAVEEELRRKNRAAQDGGR